MSEIKDLVNQIIKFRDERDWKRFHAPKDSAIALLSEATEVLEHFKWKNKKEVKEHVRRHKKEIGDELCDVLFWVLLMAHDFKIDIKNAFFEKMIENRKKYPIEKPKGRYTKYTDL